MKNEIRYIIFCIIACRDFHGEAVNGWNGTFPEHPFHLQR